MKPGTVLLVASLGVFAAQQGDPWSPSDVLQPKDFAARLAVAAGSKPLVLFVGPVKIYSANRIPGALLAGPAASGEGLERLKETVKKAPRDRAIVIYCGCCPSDQCPNIRPAYRALREMGFKDVKVVMIPTTFNEDWVSKGYPTDRAESGNP